MIPNKIHYCWFGKAEKNKLVKKCISSWKKYMPNYEIIEWNEENFNVNQNEYCKYCYSNKKWAFLSDYVRLVVVSEHGGIYFDTDVETIKSFDDLCNYSAFYGFENSDNIATGLGFGAEAHHPTIEAMRDEYSKLKIFEDGSVETVVCPQMNTKALLPFGLKLDGSKQILDDTAILPVDWLNPYDDPTGVLKKSDNTHSIHWYSKSWMSKYIVFRSKLIRPIHRIFGSDCFLKFKSKS